MITIYGIANCDTIKKALLWFSQNKIEVNFHDYKKLGITEKKLASWCSIISWELLLNKKSTTWRELEAVEKEKITSQNSAIQLMQQCTSIIKRPVIENNKTLLVGFNEKIYQQTFKNKL
ncbi:MAG: Spx/MgsR family RNA polymerase-binding regulatory protein [Chitinophagaceae bacterium]|nr:Spx/MgsR family RNA polymerase-binding regulatory protein [Chitinophagaceae bacterium]